MGKSTTEETNHTFSTERERKINKIEIETKRVENIAEATEQQQTIKAKANVKAEATQSHAVIANNRNEMT